MTPKAPAGTQSIMRTLQLMKALGTRRNIGWRLTDLAAHCGLNHSTAHRIVACLASARFVKQRRSDRRYVPGPMLYEFALAIPGYLHFQAACDKNLARVARRTGWIGFLYLRSGEETLCISRVGTTAVHVLNDVGNRRPLAGSALGAAILLALPKGEQRAVLMRNRKELRRNPAHRERAYDAMWQRSRELGFGANLGDVIAGIGSVGVPILGAKGVPVAAIGATGSAAEFTSARVQSAVQLLREEADRIQGEHAALIAELS